MTFGQMKILTDRLQGILGNSYAPKHLKLKRLDSLQDDVRNSFDIINDDIAFTLWLNITDYLTEVR